MESIATWPLLQRNKVEDSQIEVPVQLLSESDNEVVANMAKKVSSHPLGFYSSLTETKRVVASRTVVGIGVGLPYTETFGSGMYSPLD